MTPRMWLEATRPRTLSAAVVPVAVGTAIAPKIFVHRAILALVVAAALQIAVNFANDYFDGRRGIDTADRVGPRRFTALGLASGTEMRAAIGFCIAVALAAGLGLAWSVGWELLLVGAAAVIATLAYSGGPKPYASFGFGEVSVFIFFGLVATAGSLYVQTRQVPALAVAAGCAVGSLASAILVVNNLRDIPTDRAAGKRTLAVRLGQRGTERLFIFLVCAAFSMIPVICWLDGSLHAVAAAGALPAAVPAVRAVRAGRPERVARGLGATSRLHLAFGGLLAAGLWI